MKIHYLSDVENKESLIIWYSQGFKTQHSFSENIIYMMFQDLTYSLIKITDHNRTSSNINSMRVDRRFALWFARILSIGYILFLSLFSLDVFSAYSGVDVILPLLIHLIPSLLLLLIAVIAWKYELVGAIVFFGFAGWYVWHVGLSKPVSWYLSIALPSVVIAALYLVSWLEKQKTSVMYGKNNS